jgi:hypothetical protein
MKLLTCLVLAITFHSGLHAMDYYTFEIDGKNCGYYTADDAEGVFSSNAYIEMQGEKFENPFWIKHNGLVITHFRFGDNVEWIPISKYPEGTFPSSALDLLIKRTKDGAVFKYDQLNEGSGKITKDVQLIRNGNRIEEMINGKVHRYVVIDKNEKIIEYGWGGTAVSKLTTGRDEAIKGTVFK